MAINSASCINYFINYCYCYCYYNYYLVNSNIDCSEFKTDLCCYLYSFQ